MRLFQKMVKSRTHYTTKNKTKKTTRRVARRKRK